MPRTFPFSKTKIDALPPAPKGGRVDYYDQVQKDLIIRVTATGSKSFYVRKNKQAGRANDRFFLGTYPDLPIELARKQAAILLAQLAIGKDPNKDKSVLKAEPTLQIIFETYIEGHAKPRCVRIYDMEADFRRYVSDWSDRKCSSITKAETQARLNLVHKKNGPAAANHLLVLMRAVFNWNMKNGYIQSGNPWSHLKLFKIQSRERFLKPEEVQKLFVKLEKLPNHNLRDFVLLSLYTGARRNNVLSMRWEDVDLSLATWRIPRTRNGDWQIVPLTTMALDVLNGRPSKDKSEWVFPGKDPLKHFVDPKKAWQSLLKSAEIENLRLHDLRRTLGSYMAMSNHSLKMIGSALGHRSSSATEIYARIANDALRSAMQLAQENMLKPIREPEDEERMSG